MAKYVRGNPEITEITPPDKARVGAFPYGGGVPVESAPRRCLAPVSSLALVKPLAGRHCTNRFPSDQIVVRSQKIEPGRTTRLGFTPPNGCALIGGVAIDAWASWRVRLHKRL